MSTATTVKCQYCGKECKARGVKAHEQFHCPKRPSAAPDSGAGAQCAHVYKFLNPNLPDHARAMNDPAGYSKYCAKCGDLK